MQKLRKIYFFRKKNFFFRVFVFKFEQWYCLRLSGIDIREEIRQIENIPPGESSNADGWSRDVNPLKMAPHTQWDIGKPWKFPYPISKAAFPTDRINPSNKIWPGCGRVDDLYGDQNLICACPPLESYVSGGTPVTDRTAPTKGAP